MKAKIISFDDEIKILYFPGIIDNFEEIFPDLGNALHLGTELEDVAELIPEKLEQSICEIRKLNSKLIKFDASKKQHVFYKIL